MIFLGGAGNVGYIGVTSAIAIKQLDLNQMGN